MLRRSLLVFVGFLFLVLLLTVGYALTGLSGPETTIQDARAAFEARDFEAVIKQLDWLERDVVDGGSAAVLEEALRMRYRAHLARGNLPQALADLDTLLAEFAPQDQGLIADRVVALLRAGDNEPARQEAEKLAAARPDSTFVLDLAGRANEAVFEANLRETLADLSRKLSSAIYSDAVTALLPYLFRPTEDRAALQGRQAFDAILKKYREQDFVVRTYDRSFETLRRDIRRSRDCYVRALENGGPTTWAFPGLAEMLGRAGQPDALIALAETHLRRFPESGAEAARYLTQLHVDAGRYRSAHEVAMRFLGGDTWEQAGTKRRFGDEVRHLLLADARALHALGDKQALEALADAADRLASQGLRLNPELLRIRALAMDLAGRPGEVVTFLTRYCDSAEIRGAPELGEDPYQDAATMLVSALRKMQAGSDRITTTCGHWMQARPLRPEPLLESARYHLEQGLGGKALADAARAYELAGQNEEALQVYAEAADLAQRPARRDSEHLLAQCISHATTLPTGVALDVLYLPLSRRALEAKEYAIALAASRRAAQIYNWARQPRILWATAALQMHDPEQAIQALELLRERDPEDPQVLAMMREARSGAGATTDTLLFDVAMLGVPDAAVARTILEGSLARRDATSGVGAALTALARFPNDDRIALSAARVLSAFRRGQQARDVLLRLVDHPDADLRTAAVIAILLQEARDGGSTEVSLAELASRLAECDAATLLDLANSLRALHRPRLAYDVLEPVLQSPRHQGARSGAHHLLAGRLALELRLYAEAELHLTAALTFEDGKEASRPLTLLLLRDQRETEAADTYWDDDVTDAIGACLAARFGRIALARPWLHATTMRNPSDVCALLLRHVPGAGLDRLPALRAAAELMQTTKTRDLVLDVLLFTAADGFEHDGLRRAEALRERFPENAFARLLHCRALARDGSAAEALESLTLLVTAHPQFAPGYDEILAIRNRYAPSTPLSPEVNEGIFQSAFVRSAATSPLIDVQAARELATRFMQAGNQNLAQLILTQEWIRHPTEAQVGAGELDLLLADGQHQAVADVLAALEVVWPADRRARFLDLYGTYATRLAAAGAPAALLSRVEDRVRKIVDAEGPHGALVQFLILRDQQLAGSLAARNPRRSPERLQAALRLLHGHVALFESGRDKDLGSLLVTLRQIELFEDASVALAETDRLLRRDLSLLPLWRLRSELLERAGDVDAALKTLAHLLDYHDDPDAVIELVRMLAQSGEPVPPAIAARFAELEPPFKGSPRANFAAGLVALRQGDHERAAELLANAEERADGARQFYEALARLPLPDAAAGPAAAAAFATVAARYPNSSFAEISEHLSRQLGLASSAASTPAKR